MKGEANRILDELDAADLKFSIHGGRIAVTKEEFKPLREARDQFVRDYIARALERTQGRVSAAARLLGLSHQSLNYIIERDQELLKRRVPKQTRRKSIITTKKEGVRCFHRNPS